ncbi:hypothetical protein [Kitasatospora sp. CB02891]|uniref:hypothetical protein n=1 Tax=Kitasatospora sp. CB02891 TaxID=2020329 RepID=UPI000C27DA4E|nr:hypothetical protein [Kitasatospora sp. CB02891]PJN21137.1 hypothetical protein CG736_34920 [Kitasatospora sp. CB02891]
MTATFGDFVQLTDEHLSDLVDRVSSPMSELVRKALIAQLAAFTDVLVTVEQRFAWEAVAALPHRSTTAAGRPATQAFSDAGVRGELHMGLAEALQQLRSAAGKPQTVVGDPPVLQPLPRASRALRTGLDLLATHTGPDGEALSRHGVALESDELRTAVLATVMPFTAVVGQVAIQLAAATTAAFPGRTGALYEAGRKLLIAHQQAQLLSIGARLDGHDQVLGLMTPRTGLQADPPRGPESVEQLAVRAAAGADRLAEFAWRVLDSGDHQHVHTAAAMGTVAANVSALYSLGRALLAHTSLAQDGDQESWRASEWSWRDLAACWRPVRTAPDSPTSLTPVAAESHALVDRVGRLLFANPVWRLTDGGGGPRRAAAELVAAAPVWTEALRHISGQLGHLADDYAEITRRLAHTRRLLLRASGVLTGRRAAQPLSAERQQELQDGYRRASAAAGAVEALLASAAGQVGVDPAARTLQHLAAQPGPAAVERMLVRQSAARLAAQGLAPQVPEALRQGEWSPGRGLRL